MTPGGQERTERRFWAAVAFKGTVGAKRRLAGLLSDEERAQLGLAMLDDVLGALGQVSAIETVLLVTADASLANDVERPGVRIVLEAGDSAPRGAAGLNPAFELAQRLAAEAEVDGLLLLPADLPLASAAAVQAVLRA